MSHIKNSKLKNYVKSLACIIRQLFNLDPEVTFTNHGSYGSTPKIIFDQKIQLQYEMERSPDKWFRMTSFNLWNQSLDELSKYLKIDKKNVVICENATEAINSVLKSINFKPNEDVILATQYTYQAVLNSIEYTSKYRLPENQKINVIKVAIKFPIETFQDMLNTFDETFDAAHAIGQIEINLQSLDCDFYVSNLHKWFLAPRGCSFLYFKDLKKLNHELQPCYISHGYKCDLSYNFYQRGTSDKTSWFMVKNCIDYYENVLGGLENITKYNSAVLEKAVDLLVESWGTQSLQIPKEMEAPFMKNVELPVLVNYQVGLNDKPESKNFIVGYHVLFIIV
ncbi:unnamed protein product [Brachionus calyciflorus]|uniref:Aminotransferase class V domain-containing protein n=1 Tax=Brachionus calyciflorus TaxID=104777 RepID=A0A813N2R6_9BILA|nr:unnamed protein product [Brachionus calyciflorus]